MISRRNPSETARDAETAVEIVRFHTECERRFAGLMMPAAGAAAAELLGLTPRRWQAIYYRELFRMTRAQLRALQLRDLEATDHQMARAERQMELLRDRKARIENEVVGVAAPRCSVGAARAA